MSSRKVTEAPLDREGLKEILKVNFELYKDEPDFFDYLTTLVIYLMEYEYEGGARPGAGNREQVRKLPGVEKVNKIDSRYQVHDGCCPHCNNKVPPSRNICPYCLALIQR